MLLFFHLLSLCGWIPNYCHRACTQNIALCLYPSSDWYMWRQRERAREREKSKLHLAKLCSGCTCHLGGVIFEKLRYLFISFDLETISSVRVLEESGLNMSVMRRSLVAAVIFKLVSKLRLPVQPPYLIRWLHVRVV